MTHKFDSGIHDLAVCFVKYIATFTLSITFTYLTKVDAQVKKDEKSKMILWVHATFLDFLNAWPFSLWGFFTFWLLWSMVRHATHCRAALPPTAATAPTCAPAPHAAMCTAWAAANGPTSAHRRPRYCTLYRPRFFPKKARAQATPTLEIIEECPGECNSVKKQLVHLLKDLWRYRWNSSPDLI